MANSIAQVDDMSPGHQLRVFRAERRLSQAGLGLLIGQGTDRVCRFERMQVRPNLVIAARIERITDGRIPASSWVDDSDLTVAVD